MIKHRPPDCAPPPPGYGPGPCTGCDATITPVWVDLPHPGGTPATVGEWEMRDPDGRTYVVLVHPRELLTRLAEVKQRIIAAKGDVPDDVAQWYSTMSARVSIRGFAGEYHHHELDYASRVPADTPVCHGWPMRWTGHGWLCRVPDALVAHRRRKRADPPTG